MLFSGLAFFTKAVPLKTRALWKQHGGRIVLTPAEFFEATFMFCAGSRDPELNELLSRRIIVRGMAWIELCVSESFLMPIAEYTLDENSWGDSDGSFDSTTSRSMTVVGDSSSQELLVDVERKPEQAQLKSEPGSPNVRPMEPGLEPEVDHFREATMEEIEKPQVTRTEQPQQQRHKKAVTPVLIHKRHGAKRSKSILQAAASLSKKTMAARGMGPRIITVQNKPFSAAIAPSLVADHRLKSLPSEALPVSTTDPLHELLEAIPDPLRHSMVFQGMVASAVEIAFREPSPSSRDKSPTRGLWKQLKDKGRYDKENVLHIPVDELLKITPYDMVVLNIGEVYKNHSFQIANPEVVIA